MDAFTRLIELLDQRRARYRVLEHEPEGRTDIVSAMRGHDPRGAAKCMIVMVKIGKKTTKHVLAVVPGDSKVNLGAIKALFGGTYVAFASPEVAEELSATVVGTVLPFAFHPQLELIVDPSLLQSDEIFFNAGRLDRSLALKTADYVSVASPRFEVIAARTIA